MAQSPNLLNRYIWLLNLVSRAGALTLPEISEAWEHSTLNPVPGEPLRQRSFIRHRKAISELFNIDIVCRKRDNTYYIADTDKLRGNDLIAWVVNTLAIEGHLRHNPALRSRILLDTVPGGEQFLRPIVEAMERNRCVTADYRSFHSLTFRKMCLEPYCLKAYGRRWYMLGRDTASGKLEMFGLDRIGDLEVTDVSYSLPEGFVSEEYFSEFIGVINDFSTGPETVKISIDDDFAPHLRNVPLHPSQTEGHIDYPDGSRDATFTWHLRPTPDFLMELYRYGSSLEVISPPWVRDTIARWAAHHNELYSGK